VPTLTLGRKTPTYPHSTFGVFIWGLFGGFSLGGHPGLTMGLWATSRGLPGQRPLPVRTLLLGFLFGVYLGFIWGFLLGGPPWGPRRELRDYGEVELPIRTLVA
jgi:hypothetical protein